jgi:hypothetical protein
MSVRIRYQTQRSLLLPEPVNCAINYSYTAIRKGILCVFCQCPPFSSPRQGGNPGLKGPSSSKGNECWDTKRYGFSVVMRNEYCRYGQHLFLTFTKSRELYTHIPSIITYEYVHRHILCTYSLIDDIIILCVMPSNDWMTVNCKGYGRTRLWSSLEHDHWTHLEALRKTTKNLTQGSLCPDGFYEHVPLKHTNKTATLIIVPALSSVDEHVLSQGMYAVWFR